MQKRRCHPPIFRPTARENLPEKMTMAQAANYAQCSDASIRSWNNSGKFAYRAPGMQQYRVDREKFLAYIDGRPYEPFEQTN